MFSGIISKLGTISAIEVNGPNKSFVIDTEFDKNIPTVGESIAVNGVCVTATEVTSRSFSFFASSETLSVTNFRFYKVSEQVNLERSLAFGDRISGHFVSGHVDGVGEVKEKEFIGDACFLKIKIPSNLINWVIPKGSIAVDGVSLTVNKIEKDEISLTIIPETQSKTIFNKYQVGTFVNLECDQIIKAVIVSTERLRQQL